MTQITKACAELFGDWVDGRKLADQMVRRLGTQPEIDYGWQGARRRIIATRIQSIGIDGKTSFHIVGLGNCFQVAIRKKFSRSQLLQCMANLASPLIGIEAEAVHFSGTSIARARA